MFISDNDFIKLKPPKISWDKDDCMIRVYCDIGEDYSQFCFKFDYEVFLYYYNECKGRFRLVEGDGYYDKWGDYHMSYLDFSRKVLAENGGADDVVVELFSLIMRFYQLNPSICHRVVFKKFKGKGHTRRLQLLLKKSAVDKLKFGKSNMGGSRTKGTKVRNPDTQLMAKLAEFMNEVVVQSAKSHSLQLFEDYKSLYVQWEVASGIRSGYGSFMSKSKEKSLFMKYKSLVENLQK